MTDGIVQHVEEIITEIDMSRDGRPWVIVEGNSDEKFGILHKYFTLSETIPYLKGVSPKKCKLLLC